MQSTILLGILAALVHKLVTCRLQSTSRTFADAIRSNLDKEDVNEVEESEDSSAEELKQWDQRFKSKDNSKN